MLINMLYSSIHKWTWKIRRIIVVNLAPFWQRPYLCIYPLVCVKREGVGALAVGRGLGGTVTLAVVLGRDAGLAAMGTGRVQ